MGGRESRVIAGRPRPAGDSRPRGCRGPGIQPFTLDPGRLSQLHPQPFGRLLLNGRVAEGRPGSGRAGWTLGGDSAQSAPPFPGPNHGKDRGLGHCVARQPSARSRSVSGSERWPEQAAARPGRFGRLEDLQKVLPGQKAMGRPSLRSWLDNIASLGFTRRDCAHSGAGCGVVHVRGELTEPRLREAWLGHV
jgi:hypothetical protein